MRDFERFKNQSFMQRVRFAWSGIADAAKASRSFKTQLVLASLTALMFWALGAEVFWWIAFVIASSSIMALELLNTAIEHTLDALKPDYDPGVRRAKDSAAGAVLVSSLGSIGIFIIFLLTRYSP